MRSKQYFTSIKNNPHEISTDPKNKLSFRTLAGVESYQQIDLADSIQASLTQRAEIEALNIADRQIDIAWLAEGSKVNKKLSDFEKNINRIISSGGTANDRTRWNEYYNMFQTAIKETQDAYMPNAQRKRQYLAIYADIEHQNEILIAYLIQLSNRSKTASLLSARLNRRTDVASHATEAFSRWREAGQLNSGGHN